MSSILRFLTGWDVWKRPCVMLADDCKMKTAKVLWESVTRYDPPAISVAHLENAQDRFQARMVINQVTEIDIIKDQKWAEVMWQTYVVLATVLLYIAITTNSISTLTSCLSLTLVPLALSIEAALYHAQCRHRALFTFFEWASMPREWLPYRLTITE